MNGHYIFMYLLLLYTAISQEKPTGFQVLIVYAGHFTVTGLFGVPGLLYRNIR